MKSLKFGCAAVCCLVAGALQAQGTLTRSREIKIEPGEWVAAAPLTLPSLPPGLPAGSAGCVVVGQHLDAQGATSKPRVMQGAFTNDVAAETQKVFMAHALDASSRWRFRFNPPNAVPSRVARDLEASGAPKWAFHRVVVGFAHSALGATPLAVLDADRQDARVAAQCRLEPLAQWGKRNAVATEAAMSRTGDPVLVATGANNFSYWTASGVPAVPRFPVSAIQNGFDACVILGFMIGVDGVPADFRIMSTRTVAPTPVRKAFEDAALAAASTWRYEPGPDNLKRLPEFRQTPVDFAAGIRRNASECKAVDLSALSSSGSP